MKPDIIKTSVMPAMARDATGLTKNQDAKLPNDFGKS